MQSNVLTPAHLTSTRIGDWFAVIPRRIRGYTPDQHGGFVNARHFSSTIGYSAGGYVSSAEDLARWYDALGSGRIISRAMLDEALKPATLSDGQVSQYGFGWYLSVDAQGRTIANAGGSTYGFRAHLYWRPADGSFAAVMMNSEGDEPQDQARSLSLSGG